MENAKIEKITAYSVLKKLKNDVSTVLSRAFYLDPNYSYMMPNDLKRLDQTKWWMEIMLEYGFRYGEVYVASNNLGASIWLGPDKPLVNDLRISLMGLILFPFKVGILNFLRMMKVMNRWAALHKQEASRHMYLMIIGVEPKEQGNGIGSKLLAPVLAKADQEGLSCYLETVTEMDVNFYQKNGFNVVNHGIVNNKIEYWTMRREPQF